jgi:hypothetical protein
MENKIWDNRPYSKSDQRPKSESIVKVYLSPQGCQQMRDCSMNCCDYAALLNRQPWPYGGFPE